MIHTHHSSAAGRTDGGKAPRVCQPRGFSSESKASNISRAVSNRGRFLPDSASRMTCFVLAL
jgi:hypothetical protein